MSFKIREIAPRDLSGVILVEQACFPNPWVEHTFQTTLSERQNRGWLVEVDSKIVGYMIYRTEKSRLCIISMAISPNCRRQKIGFSLIKKLIDNLTPPKNRICLTVNDANLGAHYFFKSLGFEAVGVMRDFYGDQDGYNFVYRIGLPEQPKIKQPDECKGYM